MREIRILQSGDLPALEAFLLPRLSSSMILLGNSRSAGLCDRGDPYQGTYAGAFEDGALTGVAAHYWNGNLFVQAEMQAAELCRCAMAASRRPLAGLLGPNAQALAVLAALQIAPDALQLDSVESLFQLRLTELRIPPALDSGAVRVRRAKTDDLAKLTELAIAYDRETLHEADTPEHRERARATMERMVRDGRLWLAETERAIVAMSGFNAVMAEAVQIGSVFTPPALRSRGYARAAVAQSLLDARSTGARVGVLFTGDADAAAQRAYRALGFERVGDYRISLLSAPRAVP